MRSLYADMWDKLSYLNSIKHTFEGLYQSDIERVNESIDQVFIELPRLQSFFEKLFDKEHTSRLLTACINRTVISIKSYLTGDGATIFWDLPADVMAERLKKCVALKDRIFRRHSMSTNSLRVDQNEQFRVHVVTTFNDFVAYVDRLDQVSKDRKARDILMEKFGCNPRKIFLKIR